MNWRPEVDYSKNKMDRPDDHIDNSNFRRGWEASADAMLEALRKEGQHGKGTEFTNPALDTRNLYRTGTLVFIPDDEVQK